MHTNHYYNQLNKLQQRAYFNMKEGLEALAPSFYVPRLTGKELAEIYFLVRLDNPEIFYSTKFVWRYYDTSENVEIVPDYMFEKKKIKEQQQALETRVKKLALPAEKLSDKDKLLYIHDFICSNITYDKLKKAYSHEIIGALGHGVAVCEGISKTVKILCDRLNIPCVIALAEANPEKGIKYRHAWNVVKIGGKQYHFDATFDNSLGKDGQIRYDYFCLSDKQIFRDHQPLVRPVPECTDGSAAYYLEKKLSFTKYEDVQKRSLQAAKKGKILVFNWRGGYLTKEVLQDLVKIINESGAEKGKKAAISVNWPQAVLQVKYEAMDAPLPEEAGEDGVVMQEANEGELYGADEE